MTHLFKNSYYEGLLQDLFCGKDGFFTIFMHFFYQKNQIFINYPDFYNSFCDLLSIELTVCERVSKVIIELGGDAKFYSSAKKYISGSGVDYIKNLASMLELDIELIEKNIIDLKSVYSKVENGNIRASLNEILVLKNEEINILKNCFLGLENFNNKKNIKK